MGPTSDAVNCAKHQLAAVALAPLPPSMVSLNGARRTSLVTAPRRMQRVQTNMLVLVLPTVTRKR
jgi:hypothetical protein